MATIRAELLIRMTTEGQVSITGPIQEKLLCYGMLELAKDAIREFRPQAQPRVVLADAMPANGSRGRED